MKSRTTTMSDDNNITPISIGSIEADIRAKTREMSRQRSIPVSPPPTQTTQDILQHILQTEHDLRTELANARSRIEGLEETIANKQAAIDDMHRKFTAEENRARHFEGMLRRIAELVVNGTRNGPEAA